MDEDETIIFEDSDIDENEEEGNLQGGEETEKLRIEMEELANLKLEENEDEILNELNNDFLEGEKELTTMKNPIENQSKWSKNDVVDQVPDNQINLNIFSKDEDLSVRHINFQKQEKSSFFDFLFSSKKKKVKNYEEIYYESEMADEEKKNSVVSKEICSINKDIQFSGDNEEDQDDITSEDPTRNRFNFFFFLFFFFFQF